MSHLFAAALPESNALIQWKIGDTGFEMTLSGEVPGRIAAALDDPSVRAKLYNGWSPDEIDSWAVHAGGRSILDAVEKGLDLPQGALFASRDILARYGNMSSSTLMFVLAELLGRPDVRKGVAIAFGPGLAAEGFHFERAGETAPPAAAHSLSPAGEGSYRRRPCRLSPRGDGTEPAVVARGPSGRMPR